MVEKLTKFPRITRLVSSISPNIFLLLGLEADALYSLMYRSWTLLAGAALVLVLPFWLTPEEQGLFFVFYSMIGLQVFFELGLNQIVLQRLSACFGELSLNGSGCLDGSESRVIEFYSIIESAKSWYRNISVMFFLFVVAVGISVIISTQEEVMSESIRAFIILLFLVSVNIKLSIELTMMQAIQRVSHVAKLRTFQSIVGYGVLLTLIFYLNVGLIAIVSISLTSCLMTFFWLKFNAIRFPSNINPSNINPTNRISWKRDYFPLQWKIALSWIFSYFMSQLMIPVIYRTHGSVDAGKVGMALSISFSLVGLGLSLTSAKIPIIARLIATGENLRAYELFRISIFRALLLNSILLLGFVMALTIFPRYFEFLLQRIADMEIIVMLSCVALSNTVIFSIGAYLRAHNEEPMLYMSITLALLVVINLVIFQKSSLSALLLVYTLIITCIGTPWALFLLKINLTRNELKFSSQ